MHGVLSILFALVGCGGSPGRLVNASQPVAQLVSDNDPLLVATDSGLERIRINGSDRRPIAASKYELVAMTPDGAVFALEDSETNLYVLEAGGPPRRVAALDHRAGAVAISPDGMRIAAAKHADFSRPQSEWDSSEDDAVWLIDTKTLATEVIPKSCNMGVTNILWAPDGASITLGLSHGDFVQLDLATKVRKNVDRPVWHGSARDVCTKTGDHLQLVGWQGDQGIDILDASGAKRHFVVIEGRSRGFHDYRPTVDTALFSRSCKYVVFTFNRSIWIGDVASGAIGHLISGRSPRLLEGP
jgi:dipeptidyl aminopeptidase/acylaminoacyl peptidase